MYRECQQRTDINNYLMRRNSETSSYSQFRKKRPTLNDITPKVCIEIQEIEQMSRELDMITRNRKASNASPKSNNCNLQTEVSLMETSYDAHHDLLTLPQPNNNASGRFRELNNRQGLGARRSRANQGNFRTNSSNKTEVWGSEVGHHYSTSPYTDRDSPQSPLFPLRVKSERPPQSSMESTCNSIEIAHFEQGLTELALQRLEEICKKIRTGQLTPQTVSRLMCKIDEMEGVLEGEGDEGL